MIISSATHAQTTNFVGPSVALSGSYVGGSSEFKTGTSFGTLSAGDGIDSKLGDQTNVIPGVDLNYGFAMGVIMGTISFLPYIIYVNLIM